MEVIIVCQKIRQQSGIVIFTLIPVNTGYLEKEVSNWSQIKTICSEANLKQKIASFVLVKEMRGLLAVHAKSTPMTYKY